MGAGIPAAVRFLDPTSQRTLATDGEPPRAGEIGAAQETRGQDEFVVGAERFALRGDFRQQDFGNQGASPAAFVIRRDGFPPDLRLLHIDP